MLESILDTPSRRWSRALRDACDAQNNEAPQGDRSKGLLRALRVGLQKLRPRPKPSSPPSSDSCIPAASPLVANEHRGPAVKDSAWQWQRPSTSSPPSSDPSIDPASCTATPTCTAREPQTSAAAAAHIRTTSCCASSSQCGSAASPAADSDDVNPTTFSRGAGLEEWEVPAEFSPAGFARHREPLATGGFSTVYRCRPLPGTPSEHTAPPTLIVKVLDLSRGAASTRKLAEHEVQVLRDLQDLPHVVRLHRSFHDTLHKRVYIVFEYLEGATLVDAIRLLHPTTRQGRVGTVPLADTKNVMRNAQAAAEELTGLVASQLLQTLADMHRRGISHGDIKPDNIFLREAQGATEPRSIRLLDFGLSTRLGTRKYVSECRGTIPYLAPEQIRAAVLPSPFDPREADMWAVGVTLMACLFGQLPFLQDFDEDESGSGRHGRGAVWWGVQLAREHQLWGGRTTLEGSSGLKRTFGYNSRTHPMRRRLAALARGLPAGADAEGFFGGLLAVDPARRLTAAEALQHPYMRYMRAKLSALENRQC